MRMKSSSVRKKVREPSNVTKELSHMMLVACDVGTAQCEDGTVKCEKKK